MDDNRVYPIPIETPEDQLYSNILNDMIRREAFIAEFGNPYSWDRLGVKTHRRDLVPWDEIKTWYQANKPAWAE